MDAQTLINELTECKTMLEVCTFNPDDCENCPVADSCLKFSDDYSAHFIMILDEAIEKLKKSIHTKEHWNEENDE